MGKIFCLMGKSSSGKDTVFKEVLNDKSLKLKPIVGYTTRPKRDNETNGLEYFFINKSILEDYRIKGKIIEERIYNTVKGKWHYCTIDDGQIDFKNNYIFITTLEAYLSLKDYFKEDKIVPFYIEVEDGLRLERALKRETQQKNPNYKELCRRFLADSEDFSEEKLIESGIIKRYVNNNLEDCIKEVKKDILDFI